MIVYALFSSVVYPQWLEPMLKIHDDIARRQEEFDRLDELELRVERASAEYRGMVARIGSFDPANVETEIRAHINELIEKHELQDVNVAPSRPSEDRKTGLTRMQITVTAMGKLEQVIGFLKDSAEMSQLVHVGNAAVYPAGGGRKGQSRNRVNLRLPLEIMILPQNKIVGRIEESELVRPVELPPRHLGRDYSSIWSRKPFREPIPLNANAGRDVKKRQGQTVRLTGTATGGEPPYTCAWSPSDGLTDPAKCKTEVDTLAAFDRTYTLTVKDDEDKTITDTIKIVIEETRVARRRPPPPPPPLVKRDRPWKDARNMQLIMTLLRKLGDEQISELMVHNKKARKTQYYAVGDGFNGGELVFVHPRGGVARRNNEYLLFPVGAWLSDEVKAGGREAAIYYPELNRAADQLAKANPDAVKQSPSAGSESARDAAMPAKSTASQRNRISGRRATKIDEDKPGKASPAVRSRRSGPRAALPRGTPRLGKKNAPRPRLRKTKP